MPRESIQMLVLSAEKEAVKRFLSQVHQSWDQLDMEVQVQEDQIRSDQFHSRQCISEALSCFFKRGLIFPLCWNSLVTAGAKLHTA